MFSLLLSILLSTSAHAYLVISDVDDTIKITNSGNTAQAAWSGLFKNDVFPGMPEIYRAWAEDGAELHFVTASPNVLNGKIKQLLQHHKVPAKSLTTRKNLLESKLQYKTRVISQLMDQYPHEAVVLVGDDVGQDPEVFELISQKYRDRVLTSYIRPVKARRSPAGLVPYVTAFDIASHERREGRLGAEIIVRATIAVLTGEASKLLPKFTWCPKEIDNTGLPTDTSPYAAAERIEERVEKICQGRNLTF